MQDLNRLEVQGGPDGYLVTGSGNRWGNVYEYLNTNYHRGIAGGRNGDVGVGGFLLGGMSAISWYKQQLTYPGGVTFFPNLYGMGADSVVSFKVSLTRDICPNHHDLNINAW